MKRSRLFETWLAKPVELAIKLYASELALPKLIKLPLKVVLPPTPIFPVVRISSAPVSIDPKPEVIEPASKSPTVVSEEVTTLEARVVPVSVPAGAITALVEAAVINPLPLTVKEGIAVEEPKLPVLELTVARVVANEPVPLPVTSPVNVIVWSPVLVPDRLEPDSVPVALIFPLQEKFPVVPASAIEQRVLVPSLKARVDPFPILSVVSDVERVVVVPSVREEAAVRFEPIVTVPVAVNASDPMSILPNPEVIEPEFSAPTVVKDEVRTPVPKVLFERTLVPFIL
jgi:hypothetical protein